MTKVSKQANYWFRPLPRVNHNRSVELGDQHDRLAPTMEKLRNLVKAF
jgi:hypothetical protein